MNRPWYHVRPYIAVLATTTMLTVVAPSTASAHRSGCHRWHSCPSDTGSYTCGDLGYTSECGTGTTTTTSSPPNQTVSTLVINGPRTVTVGDVVSFDVSAKNAGGQTVAATPTWSVDSERINYGVWRAPRKAGTYRVSATTNGVTGYLDVTVIPSRPYSVRLQADSNVAFAGTPLWLQVIATDIHGNVVPSPETTWSVRGAGEVRSGIFSARKAGRVEVGVTVNGIPAWITIEVKPATVKKVLLSPGNVSLKSGESVRFSATAYDEFDNVVVDPKVNWTATGGSISPQGVFTSSRDGKDGEVRASVETSHGTVLAKTAVKKSDPAVLPPQEASKRPETAGQPGAVVRTLKSLTASGAIVGGNSSANLPGALVELIRAAQTEKPGLTSKEALQWVEASLVREMASLTPVELDLLADIQARLAKKAEAIKTLSTRLAAGPGTKSAYRTLLALEAETGDRQEMDTYVSGKKLSFDVRPVLRQGRLLVPVRALTEAIGAVVSWDAKTGKVTIVRGEISLTFTLGSDQALAHGRPLMMEVPANVENGRTLIPLRFVAEALGLHVSWLPEERAIVLTQAPLQ